MFAKLHIENFYAYGIRDFSQREIDLYKENKKNIVVQVENYLLYGDNALSAQEIERSLFPIFDADVFISHSHEDEREVINLALNLESMGLKAFVDSCYWGYAGDLQRKIDDKFSKSNNNEYHYEYKNVLHTSANINNILTSALHGMIDKSELFLFLGTDNSTLVSEEFSGKKQLKSPWISSELMFAQRVRPSLRKQINYAGEAFAMDSANARMNESVEIRKSVNFIYEMPEMKNMRWYEFKDWINNFDVRSNSIARGLEHLDNLYRLIEVPEELLKTKRIRIK